MENETGIQVLDETVTRLAPRYKVLLHNDNDTPAEFVMTVISEVFQKDTAESYEIMMEAHRHNVALVAILGFEQAEFRTDQAHSLARGRGYPLTFSVEPA